MIKIIVFLTLAVTLRLNAQEATQKKQSASNNIKTIVAQNNTQIDTLIHLARTLKGTPYVWGGHTAKGLDCTGFVHYCFEKIDIQTPYSSKYFTNYGEKIDLKDARVGDIMVFRGTNPSDKRPGHVGIITEITSEKIIFIHSSSSKKHFGVVETDYYKSGYPKRFLKVVRVV